MTVDRTHAHGATASGGATAPSATAHPGKRTQVEALSQSPGGHESAESRANAAAAHSKDKHDATVSGVNLATLQDFIAKHEGYVDHVYLDSRGFPTAGIGHLL